MRRIAIAMYAAGMFGLISAIAGPDPDPSDHTAFAVIAAVVAVGFCVITAQRTLTARRLRAHCVVFIACVCACVAVARPTNGVPLYAIWPTLLAAYALPRRDFAVVLGSTLAGLAVAIAAFVPPPARLSLWVGTALTVTSTAIAVAYLRATLDGLVRDLSAVGRRAHALARRDPLTGLANRRAFDEELGAVLAEAEGSGATVSLVLLDLDEFKQVNDRHGHACGDASLRTFAAVARGELRAGDLLARLGGEEFAVVLAGRDSSGAREVAERIGRRLRDATAAGPVPLSVSGGAAQQTAATVGAAALLAAADDALYAAKAAGRRRIGVHDGASVQVGPEIAVRPAAEVQPARGTIVSASVTEAAEGVAELARRHDDDAQLMRRVAAMLCAAGVPAMAELALLPGASARHGALIIGLSALLAAEAAALALLRRLPVWVFKAVPFAAIATIAVAIAITHPLSSTPYFFLWPAAFTAYFFSRRLLIVVIAVAAAAYALVLALWVTSPLPTSDFSTVIVPVAVGAGAVSVVRAKVRRMVEQLRHELAELRHAATHDPLTGVLDRRAFAEALGRRLESACAAGAPASLVMFDLDHFKLVNDRHGHAVGDAALRTLADTLVDGAGADGLVARLGGEEFVVLLTGCDAAQAVVVADAIAADLCARTAREPAQLAVSAGVAQADPATTPEDLLAAADAALYAAKAAGRARTVAWTPELCEGRAAA